MGRAPSAEGKTRLLRSLGAADGAGLRRALLRDTLEVVGGVRAASKAVIYTPADAEAEFSELLPAGTRLLPQRGSDLGERLHNAFVDLLEGETFAALIIGSDVPTLPSRYVELGIEALERQRIQPVVALDHVIFAVKRYRPSSRRRFPVGAF